MVIHQPQIAAFLPRHTGKYTYSYWHISKYFSHRYMYIRTIRSFFNIFSFSHIGEPFPCYYSRAYPEVVIGRYSWENNLYHLVLSLIIPNVLFAISIGVLSYWYCPCCDKACNKSSRVYAEKFPTKEEWVFHCIPLNRIKFILYIYMAFWMPCCFVFCIFSIWYENNYF